MNNKINNAANILFNARIRMKRILKLPKDCIPLDKKEAYKIQRSLVTKYLSQQKNIRIIGKKIGCTNKIAQKQINVHEPFYGDLISNYVSKSNCTLEINKFFKPYIEPEFAFIIDKEIDLLKAPYSNDEVFKSIRSVLPSIEIVDSRFEDWTSAGINNLIADNAVNAHWIYGNEKKELDSFDFSNHLVLLYINDKIIEKGNSKNVLENPINSLTWLINALSAQNISLPKGSYVTTGTCTKAIPVKKGDKIFADFGKLGNIKFDFI